MQSRCSRFRHHSYFNGSEFHNLPAGIQFRHTDQVTVAGIDQTVIRQIRVPVARQFPRSWYSNRPFAENLIYKLAAFTGISCKLRLAIRSAAGRILSAYNQPLGRIIRQHNCRRCCVTDHLARGIHFSYAQKIAVLRFRQPVGGQLCITVAAQHETGIRYVSRTIPEIYINQLVAAVYFCSNMSIAVGALS
ncbi:hypothetical protein D3C75_619790 [compost metagenome]